MASSTKDPTKQANRKVIALLIIPGLVLLVVIISYWVFGVTRSTLEEEKDTWQRSRNPVVRLVLDDSPLTGSRARGGRVTG
ncbi:MAG: hypothetical protein ABW321_35295 [Polyangiales bacterium]